jgi:thiol-disulfide isomerase/thioredoxin
MRAIDAMLLLAFACAGGRAMAQEAATPSEKKLAAIPQLEVTTLDGEEWTLAAQRGQWTVVNFWATWCKPCIKEIPDLSALDQRHRDLGVIGLAYEEIEASELRAFLKKHPAAYPIALVDVYAPPADFDTPRGLPMTYLIAPDGSVAKQFLGPVTSTEIEQVMTTHAVQAPAATSSGG